LNPQALFNAFFLAAATFTSENAKNYTECKEELENALLEVESLNNMVKGLTV
jgi:hypothetical protein